MTFEEVDSVKDDSIKYYKLLVKVHMNYVERAMNKDTAFAFNDLTEKLEGKAKEVFVNTINGLHQVGWLSYIELGLLMHLSAASAPIDCAVNM